MHYFNYMITYFLIVRFNTYTIMLQALMVKGSIRTETVPDPYVGKGMVLIKVVNSCISAGTELAGLSSSGKSMIKTLLEQPEKIRKIQKKIKSEGLSKVIDQYKLIKESGQPTGYSVSGIVVKIGEGVNEFIIGDLVAAAGGGYAYHAELVAVPKNLVTIIPDKLCYKEASTLALGAIALHSVRRINLEVGEFCVVIGTGILGLIALQILKCSGIRVIAVDIDKDRLVLARELGAEFVIHSKAEDIVKSVENFTGGYGADGVLFAASTSESDTLSLAFQMCRRKGKVVLLGVSGMKLNRKDIYSKEIDFMISTSYGPGRYDHYYEESGNDYPYPYVRWTEGRNFHEYLRLLSSKQISVERLIHGTYHISNAQQAFDALKTSQNKPLIVLLDYGFPNDLTHIEKNKKLILATKSTFRGDRINVGIIGVGNFVQAIHLPNLKKLHQKYNIYALGSQSGVKAKNVGVFYKTKYVTTDYDDIINDPNIELLMICTRHGNHASLALKALQVGKNVFLEKPLATNHSDLKALEDFYNNSSTEFPLLMVGFNRRFSPFSDEIKKHTNARVGPMMIFYRMNAGFQPAEHWSHHDGGRIIGEACHLVDFISSLTQCPLIDFASESIHPLSGKFQAEDNKVITLKYADGSVAVINYLALGNTDLSKEYCEIHFDNKSIILDDFKNLSAFGVKISKIKSKISQKGHLNELEVLYDYLRGKRTGWPIELHDLFQTTKVLLDI
jgi:predicted dehydrogenase/threonine dehydrogenase-like Zn-dependent dehydrogenase